MNDLPLCRFLPWDTEFFGVRVGRVEPHRLTPASTAEILAWCRTHAIDLLYFLADFDDPDTVRLAEENRFHLVDLRVTLDRTLDATVSPPATPSIRTARPDDLPALRAIASAAFRQSRFFFDQRISDERAGDLYAIWIEKRVREPDSQVFVADWNGEAAGFITCLLDGPHGEIDLFGVGEAARGKGLGRALVEHALQWFAAGGAGRVSVVTQGRNIAAQRLYQHCGFATAALQLWYHRWFSADVS